MSNLSEDNGKSIFRSQRVRVSGKELITPARALESGRVRPSTPVDLSRFQIVEAYREVSESLATECERDTQKLSELSARTRVLSSRGPAGAIRLCLVKYTPESARVWPRQPSIDLLTDLAHSYSDIVPVPCIDYRIEASDVSRLLGFVKSAFASIERLNNKPIMGYVPTMPRQAYPRLLDFYISNGVRSFYYDFEGRMPDHLKLRPILTHLQARKVLGGTLLYGLNARPGKFLRNANVILSRDFVSHGYGIDVLGGRHIRAPVAPQDAGSRPSRLSRAVQRQSLNRRRLFLKTDYGYHKLSSKEGARRSFPKDSKVSFDSIFADPSSASQNLFNMEQQAIEADMLRRRLCSLDRGESILSYLATKQQAKPELQRFRTVSQAKITDYA